MSEKYTKEPNGCAHPIFRYRGAQYRADGSWGQLHTCIDCGHDEIEVPDGSVMIGHAPGECEYCDEAAKALPEDQRQRWIKITTDRRL